MNKIRIYFKYTISLLILLFIVFPLLSQEEFPIDTLTDTNTENSFRDPILDNLDSMLNLWYIKQSGFFIADLESDTISHIDDSLTIQRLSNIHCLIPLTYNDKVKKYIELYMCKRKRTTSVMLGLAQYYFPWMQEIFSRHNIPEELIYLTIIESALNPNAISRAGATGIWQFMYRTGKIYGLDIDSYTDDRRDPYKATDAAAQHLKDLYNIFNDWGLAIAAYNCGSGNVRKAIARSGKTTYDYWSISPYLPRETQNYFPAFIGVLYLMKYYPLYGIVPAEVTIPSDVDTVMINKELHFYQLSKVLQIPMDEIKTLNPQYKKEVIPAFNKKYPLRLRMPVLLQYIEKQDSIHAYRQDSLFNPMKIKEYRNEIVSVENSKYYTVGKGDTIGKIAAKYHVSIQKIANYNNIKNKNVLRVGQKLKIPK